MKAKAYDLTLVCNQYLGVPYSEMDCQAFVEKCLADIGVKKDLAGSNAWFRAMTWVGSPEECKSKFGEIPKGAFLFIWANDGGEKERGYFDGKGNASHIGIYTGNGKGAIASSASRGCVAESEFHGKSINGGWNRVGLWDKLSYGEKIDNILNGGETPMIKAMVTAKQGSSVNLRERPNQNARVLKQVKLEEIVDIIEELGDWDKVEYNGITGYMMSQFLTPIAQVEPDNPLPDDGSYVTIQIPQDMAFELWTILDGVVGKG